MNNPNPKKRLWLAIGLASLCLVGVMVAFTYHQVTRPLGPALDLPTDNLAGIPGPIPREYITPEDKETEASETPIPSATATVSGDEPEVVDTLLPSQTAVTATPTSQPGKPVCGGPASMLILGIGIDTSSYRYGLADVIRIVRLDFVNKRVTSVALPRDLWIEMPDIGLPPSYTHGKLNQAYLFGLPSMGYYQGAGGGAYTLARAIQYNYGLRVNHYWAVNMSVFVNMVDAMGGVTVDGQHMSGAAALQFARTRAGTSDFHRQQNQSLLIKAMARQVLSPDIFPKVPELVKTFRGQTMTSLSLEQITQRCVC